MARRVRPPGAFKDWTEAAQAGVNLRLIQEWLGHSSPATTSVYTHLTVKAEQLGTAAINQLISNL